MSYNKESINIIYSAIAREKHTILSEFTEFSGNFSQIMEHIIKEVIINFRDPPLNIEQIFTTENMPFF